MAKEVKDLTSKEVDEVKILKTSLSECPVNTDLGCNEYLMQLSCIYNNIR